MRSRIVLRCAEGSNDTDIAGELGITRQVVGKWRQRFLDHRLDGLLDEPRPGAPRRIGDRDVKRVLQKTLEEKPRAATHWSARSMSIEKVRDLVGLYLAAPGEGVPLVPRGDPRARPGAARPAPGS